jgi:hypothetical protein
VIYAHEILRYISGMQRDEQSEHPLRKRIRHWDNANQSHFLTFSCYQRRPFLSRDRSCQWVVEAVQRARSQHSFEL